MGAVVLAFAATGAGLAADGACEQACQDEYQAASQQCQDAYQDALAEAAAKRQQCFQDASSIFDKLRCISDYELDKERAYLDLIRCENDARVAFARCLNQCQTSPSAP